MDEKLAATQVILLEWNFLDKNKIRLYFERCALYYYSIDFSKLPDRNNVFTDYGYLELILEVEQKGIPTEALQEYIGEDDLVIKEGNYNNYDMINFYDGRHDQQQDWSSGLGIKFTKKEVNCIPLELDKWKIMYQDAVLNYAEIYDEQWQTLEFKFFNHFKLMTEQLLTSKLPPNPSQELTDYKNRLHNELLSIDSRVRMRRDTRKDLIKDYAPPILIHKNTIAVEKQNKINSNVFNFWEGLKKLWS